jgi:hypothetical protein
MFKFHLISLCFCGQYMNGMHCLPIYSPERSNHGKDGNFLLIFIYRFFAGVAVYSKQWESFSIVQFLVL